MDKGKEQRDSILRAARAAREYEHEIEGRKFSLLMPTRHEARMTHHKNENGSGDSAWFQTQRDLLTNALVGWSGVTEADLVAGGNVENKIEFHPDLVPILFDSKDLWFNELWFDLKGRYDKRDEAIDESKKNWPMQSNG